jgi:uncharacterized protein (TIGR02145 family)
MKTTLALVVSFFMTHPAALGQQLVHQYNPDADNNGWIGVFDLIELLSSYETPWPPVVNFVDCGDDLLYNNHVYATLEINGRCWLSENLQTITYRNGDSLLFTSDYGHPWTSSSEGYSTYYLNDSTTFSQYGRLYNWYAVNDPRGLCPSGWIVPGKSDWLNIASTPQADGGSLKSTFGWNPSSVSSTAAAGFEAWPAGRKNSTWWSGFSGLGEEAVFWTSKVFDSEHAEAARLVYYSSELDLIAYDMNAGFSVRCVLGGERSGCTQSNYLEFDPLANSNDGSCITIRVAGCTNTQATNYDEAANFDDGSCDVANSPCDGYAAIFYDSHSYPIVEVGDQCWFKENLRSESLNNGLSLPFTQDYGSWSQWTSPGYSAFPNLAASQEFGFLYNWYFAASPQACPIGWHVPEDYDFEILLSVAGGAEIAGGSLKSTTYHWNQPNIGATNSTGYAALPCGMISHCYWCGGSQLGDEAHFWTVTHDGQTGSHVFIQKSSSQVFNSPSPFNSGFSIRCVKN